MIRKLTAFGFLILLADLPTPAPASDAGTVTRISDANQAEFRTAFSTAFGSPSPLVVTQSLNNGDTETLTYVPDALIDVAPGVVALVSKMHRAFECHVCAGALVIHYLKREGQKFSLLGSWPKIGGEGPYGEPAAWRIRTDLDDVPTLFTTIQDGGQGCYQTWVELIALTPTAPVRQVHFAIKSEYSAGLDQPGPNDFKTTGSIRDVERGKGFSVQYVGKPGLLVRYRKTGNLFRATVPEVPVC
jgi:hypothetical protein